MKANVNDPVVQSLRTKNLAGKGGIGLGASLIACGIWLDGPLPIVEAAGGAVALGGSVVYVDALLQFRAQVKNGARWDFKDEIGFKLGPGITLCTSAGCNPEIEYSVPGNIFFGYIGRASGFTGLELQAGAGWAEWTDLAHDENSPEYSDPYPYDNVKDAIEIGLSRPRLWRLGDEQSDHEAVTLGILLWDRFGANITLAQFRNMLGSKISQFASCPANPWPVQVETANNWPYPIGYFNNQGDAYTVPGGRCP